VVGEAVTVTAAGAATAVTAGGGVDCCCCSCCWDELAATAAGGAAGGVDTVAGGAGGGAGAGGWVVVALVGALLTGCNINPLISLHGVCYIKPLHWIDRNLIKVHKCTLLLFLHGNSLFSL